MPPIILTFSGVGIDLSSPQLEMIHVCDIAHHLSMICRFTGGTKWHYSVAQHSCLVASLVQGSAMKMWALLHDAAEAYVNDTSSPIKQSEYYGQMSVLERNMEVAIFRRFGLLGLDEPYLGLPLEVIEADEQVRLDELTQIMRSGLLRSHKNRRVTVVHMEPHQAETLWYKTFENVCDECWMSYQKERGLGRTKSGSQSV